MIGIILGILVGLVFATAVVSGVVLYVPFRRSAEFRWREQVRTLADAYTRHQRRERDLLDRTRPQREAEEKQLRAAAFEAFLAQISVQELESFPRIGPVTVNKLQEAGYTHLGRLRGARLHIHGLGPKRLADIDSAVRQLLTKAAGEFDNGSPRESQQLSLQLQELTVRYQQQEQVSRARLQALETLSDSLRQRLALARQVTFPRYLRSHRGSLLPPEVLGEALPDLDAVLLAAEKALPARPVAPRTEDDLPRALPADPPRAVPVNGTVPGPKAASPDSPRHLPPEPKRTPQVIMELTIQFACGVARADGPVTEKQRHVMADRILRHFQYDAALRNRAQALCAHYEKSRIALDACLARIVKLFTPEHRASLLQLAQQLLQASGRDDQAQSAKLQRLASRLQVPALAPSPARPPQEGWRALLEIGPSESLSVELIRRQYRLLHDRYAPEKLASKGPEFVALAKAKQTEALQAAEQLLRPFGQPLEEPASPPAPADLRANHDLEEFFGA
jgi:hypothetical protein